MPFVTQAIGKTSIPVFFAFSVFSTRHSALPSERERLILSPTEISFTLLTQLPPSVLAIAYPRVSTRSGLIASSEAARLIKLTNQSFEEDMSYDERALLSVQLNEVQNEILIKRQKDLGISK